MKLSNIHKGIRAAALIGGVLVVGPAVYAQGIGVPTFQELLVPTKTALDRGKVVYERNCSNCHGPDGIGQTPYAAKLGTPLPNLQAGEFPKNGGGKVQIYNTITKGTGGHPVLTNLAYQDAWAVTHYTRALGNVELTDPPEILQAAMTEAEKGICKDSVKGTIESKMAFQGEEQVAKGMQVYTANCASCHGAEGGGDGAAAAALNPPPRNFKAADEKWTNGTSPLAIFNTLANGISGTSMASFAHLPEEDRWALTHLIREKWLPAEAKQESTPEQIVDVCRSLSAAGSTVRIPIESAIRFYAEDNVDRRTVRLESYGTSWVTDGADARRGEQLFAAHCQMCHGPNGSGSKMGPYGSQPPYLWVEVSALEPASAGGSVQDFAKRTMGGAHASIPDMTGAAQLSQKDWQSLHAYVAAFEGMGEARPASTRPAPEPVQDAAPTDVEETTPDGAAESEPAEPAAKPAEPAAQPEPAAAKPAPAAAPEAAEEPKPTAPANEGGADAAPAAPEEGSDGQE